MNIYDIAREAGVSIATVSRVLNHKDTVRADTRAKVEKVLKRCSYAPSAIAQGMVSKSLHTVAVLTVDIRDSHYARTAYTIEREFGRRGYEVILCNTGGDRAETLRTLQAVAQKQVDGLILDNFLLFRSQFIPNFFADDVNHGIINMVGNCQIFLRFVVFVEINNRQRIFLAIHNALFHRHE